MRDLVKVEREMYRQNPFIYGLDNKVDWNYINRATVASLEDGNSCRRREKQELKSPLLIPNRMIRE